MSEHPVHIGRGQVIVAHPNDPAELAALTASRRAHKKTALDQIGAWMVVDAPLPLLAQYIAELPADEQQEFLGELLDRLPADSLPALGEAVRRRLGQGAA
jgi:hypothetical protein